MKRNNTCSIFLHGDSTEILFNCALQWAEQGEPVWFISPTPFQTLPNSWVTPPNKEILKLIYFIYIPESKDLVIKLSDTHLLPKLPKVIVISELDHYLFPQNTETNLTNAAFIISCLLDATRVFVTKFSSPSFLISACKNFGDTKLQTLVELYYQYCFNASEITFKDIQDIFKRINNQT